VKRAQAAYEKAVRRVAILPFRNRTSYNNQYGYLLTEELLGKCINANLKFAVFINRENLDQIFEEYKLSQSGAVDEGKAVEIGKLEGIHSFVTGTITQISVETTSPSFVEKTHEKVYTVKDSSGKSVEKREPIYYREYTAKRTVQISASYQIVDVETGRYLSGENLSENSADEAKWVRYQGSIYDLPKDKQKLLDASGEPKAADLMINDLVRVVAGKMSEKVLRFYQ
jgi:curli biogenesis system outer membrane secretion channel CsgG